MQKFTIFTVIFSAIVVTVIAELVVHDYLQKIYKNPNQLQANTLQSNSFQDYVAPTDATQNTDQETQELMQRLEELADQTSENTDESISKNPAVEPVNSAPKLLPGIFSRIESLLPALRISTLSLNRSPYQGKLFQLIDTSATQAIISDMATLDTSSGNIGTIYGYAFKDLIDSETAFDEIRLLANSFPSIDTNQTNQFGTRSFYINNLVKVGEVFIVIQKDRTIYGFGYKKDYHETFKIFFNVLF